MICHPAHLSGENPLGLGRVRSDPSHDREIVQQGIIARGSRNRSGSRRSRNEPVVCGSGGHGGSEQIRLSLGDSPDDNLGWTNRGPGL